MTETQAIGHLVRKFKMPQERAARLVSKAMTLGSWESEIFEVGVKFDRRLDSFTVFNIVVD